MTQIKVRLFIFAVLMAVIAVVTVSLPPLQPGSGAAMVIADGSDPMPLCRPGHNGCPVKPPATAKLPTPQDGGPIPLCAPSDLACRKCWPFGCK